MDSMNVAGKTIRLFAPAQNGAPLVVLHTVQNEGEAVYQAVRNGTTEDFGLAAIGGLNWDDDMSPWPIPPLFKGDTPCTGGADKYLAKLTGEILPALRRSFSVEPRYIALASYSLAGLFAVYAMYHTAVFSRIASVSGSFWYPGFLDYVRQNKMTRAPERLYFSLGDKEARSKNKILQSVEENTRWLKKWYEDNGIATIFELNPGNHFQNAAERMARGICRILREEGEAQSNSSLQSYKKL